MAPSSGYFEPLDHPARTIERLEVPAARGHPVQRSGYFEPLDHPARTIPYTPIEVMARTHRIPMPMFGASWNGTNRWNTVIPVPNGTTAKARNAGITARAGART